MAKNQLRRRIGVVLAGISVLPGAVAVATPGAAQAAASCWAGPGVRDVQGRWFSTRTCPTWVSAQAYLHPWHPGEGNISVGTLYAGNNWFVCQTRGGSNPSWGGYSNHWWLYTQTDTGGWNDGWGWFPATAVSYGANEQPVPGVPDCAVYPGYTP